MILLFSPGCAENVNDILEEAENGDPESVKEAVILLGEILSQKERAGYPYSDGDNAAIEYLKKVAESSPDATNRARALSSLGRLKRPNLGDLYVKCLEDKSSWLVRKEAADALRQNPNPQAAAPLARQIEVETRTEVRIPIIKALEGAGGEEALKALLQVFLDRSTRFRAMKLATYDSLRKLSGKNFEFEDIPSWRKYYEERFPGKLEERSVSQGETTLQESPKGREKPTEKVTENKREKGAEKLKELDSESKSKAPSDKEK